MMLFGVLLVSHSRYDLAYRSPEKPRVGMTKERVLRAVAPDLYPYTDRAEGGRLEIVRYCFRADTLIAIDRFTVPIVTEKATEPPHGSRKHD